VRRRDEILLRTSFRSQFHRLLYVLYLPLLARLHRQAGSDGIRDWKRLHLTNKNDNNNETVAETERAMGDFLHVSERTAPPELKALWKEDLADRHLARFLALRARELKPAVMMKL